MEIDFEEEPDWMPLVKIEEGTSTVQVRVSNGNKIGRLNSKKILLIKKTAETSRLYLFRLTLVLKRTFYFKKMFL
jgi:hypothetical protein